MKKFLFFLLFIFPAVTVCSQTITTVLGGGTSHSVGIPATSERIDGGGGVACDALGNLYYGDALNRRVLVVKAHSEIVDIYAGTGTMGYSGDGGPATAALFSGPGWLATDTANNLYINDGSNMRFRMVDYVTKNVYTVAGSGGSGFGGDGNPATAALFSGEQGICVDRSGNLYIVDQSNGRVRVVNHATDIVSTYAGSSTIGYYGDGGSATSAEFDAMTGICTDKSGNIYVADLGNARVRKINTSQIIYTFAGIGGSGIYTMDGLPATATPFYPYMAAVDDAGNVYVSDYQQERILKVDTFGIVHTVAGNGIAGYTGDGGPSTAAEMHWPQAICLDPCGNLYISDKLNGVVRKVTFPGTLATPTITIAASPGDTVCAGSGVTFTSSVTTSGTTPTYQWYVNGTATGTAASYSYVPVNGDVVSCTLTSSSPCALVPTATSNVITMVVNPVITPVISISASPGDTVCAGTSVSFHSSISGGGIAPTYQWYVNGTPTGTGSSYSYVPLSGDVIKCRLHSAGPCASITDTVSNVITMVVNPVITPVISISANPGDTVCAGTPVSFHSLISGGGISPTYQWYVNGILEGSGSDYGYTPVNGDSIRCEIASSGPCASIADTSSNVIALVVNPIITPAISLSGITAYSVGTTVTVTATVTGAGSYLIRWMNDGTEFATTPTPVVTYTKTAGTDTITAMVVPVATDCYDSAVSLPEYITAIVPTSVADITAAAPVVTVLPNPALTSITVISPSGIASVVIHNLPGQTVLSLPGNGLLTEVNISSLPPGLYIVTVSDNYGIKTIKKIVKE